MIIQCTPTVIDSVPW